MQWAIFRNDKEQVQFGRFDTSQDAMCALMSTGIAGYALAEYSVWPIGT